ncbi:hypothetical protein D9758_006559 [Tetrapyrgos nigripes]|uniref:F-box domain-containing protein n=1 Tax=Tetrapyrgos nigripes TaxID=182062 RepID=A0A8H5GLD2_9AGAR|nr:hypothetical protein D9758_006559 [Tetrapyrgos nigripes]
MPLHRQVEQFVDPDYDLNTTQLRTWATLSEAESNQLLTNVDSIHRQIVSYEEHIEKLRADIRAAEAQKRLAATSARRKSSLLSPIRRLPREILEHIFALYCGDNSDYSRSSKAHSGMVLDLDVPFLVLSQTCALWREIAPRAWPRISIILGLRDMSRTALGILHKHLSALPEEIPLDISVCCEYMYARIEESVNGRIAVEMVSDRASQWKSAELVMDIQLWKWLCGRQPSFGKLELMKLGMISGAGSEMKECSRVFQSATRLRKLTIARNGHDPSQLDLPFSIVTSLALEPNQQSDLGILNACSKLRTLHLDLGNIDTPVPPPLTIFRSSIAHLTLSYIKYPDHFNFFHFLHLPLLETLDVQAAPKLPEREVVLDLGPLLSMLYQSRPPLHRLSFRGAIRLGHRSNKLLEILEATPSINHLTISTFPYSLDDSESDHSVFERLIVSPKNLPLLPSLSALEISVWGTGSWNSRLRRSLNAMCNMLESRLTPSEESGAARLQSFRMVLQTCSFRDALDETRRLKALARTPGVDFSLESVVPGTSWWQPEIEKLDVFAEEEEDGICNYM